MLNKSHAIKALANFNANVGGCWLWTGGKFTKGYGGVWINGRRWMAHRLVYALFVGPLPAYMPGGPELDHRCRNHACVRPSHLELVPHSVNVDRGESRTVVNAQKTHCLRGHPLYGANLSPHPSGFRQCKECQRITRKALRDKLRGKPARPYRRHQA